MVIVLMTMVVVLSMVRVFLLKLTRVLILKVTQDLMYIKGNSEFQWRIQRVSGGSLEPPPCPLFLNIL